MKIERPLCNCHNQLCDVRSWPELVEETVLGKDGKEVIHRKWVPTNHYFCLVTGDGENAIEGRIEIIDDASNGS